MSLFDDTGMIIGNIRFLSPKEAYRISLEKEVVFVDLRPEYETIAKRIQVREIVYLHWQKFEDEYHILNPLRHFIVFDEVGLHSKDVIIFLTSKGFKNVAGMAGGIFDWERDGLPIDINKGELLTGSCACTLKPRKKFGRN